MIKEIVKTDSNKLVIELPEEYIGKKLEVLIFSDSEIIKRKKDDKTKKLLEEFERISKNISVLEDKNIDITKIDEDMYDDIL